MNGKTAGFDSRAGYHVARIIYKDYPEKLKALGYNEK